MRKLTLLRHAKSSWVDPAKADFDRPLAPKGRRAALKIGAFIEKHQLAPDLILCSPAQRTRETLARIAPFMNQNTDIQMERSIYSAGTGDGLVAYLKGLAIDVEHIMIIGHNPTMQQLALDLSDARSCSAYSKMEKKYPTAALAHIEFGIPHWHELSGAGQLVHFVIPRNL